MKKWLIPLILVISIVAFYFIGMGLGSHSPKIANPSAIGISMAGVAFYEAFIIGLSALNWKGISKNPGRLFGVFFMVVIVGGIFLISILGLL